MYDIRGMVACPSLASSLSRSGDEQAVRFRVQLLQHSFKSVQQEVEQDDQAKKQRAKYFDESPVLV